MSYSNSSTHALIEQQATSEPIVLDVLKCEVCQVNNHKYKCPRCEIKTCCLYCCKKHKEMSGCSGQRDVTKFLNKQEFDEQALISDYRFLEEQSRLIDNYQRESVNQSDSAHVQQSQHSGHFETLRKYVHSQFNINLKLMPSQSTRHLNNKTRFNRNANLVSWSLEMVFHLDFTTLASSSVPTHKSNKANLFRFHTKSQLFSCQDTLRSMLSKFYKTYKSELFANVNSTAIFNQSNGDSNQKSLKNEDQTWRYICLYKTFNNPLEHEDLGELNVLMEVIDFDLKKKYYLKLDVDKKMEECLANRTLIEYPTFYLVKTSNLSEYPIEDPTRTSHVTSTQPDEVNLCDSKPTTSSNSSDGTNKLKREKDEEMEDGECDDDDDEDESDNENYIDDFDYVEKRNRHDELFNTSEHIKKLKVDENSS
jgi:hypothetical protein